MHFTPKDEVNCQKTRRYSRYAIFVFLERSCAWDILAPKTIVQQTNPD